MPGMRFSGLFIAILVLLNLNGLSQETRYRFWVGFTDKDLNAYSIDRPEEFLSERAIQRRQSQNIPVTLQDLPVSSVYLDSLLQYPLRILYTSRWMNAAVIQTSDSSLSKALSDHPFVQNVDFLSRYPWGKKSSIDKWMKSGSLTSLVSDRQVEMLAGNTLHSSGFKGRGLIIAVLDGGFPDVYSNPGFESLLLNGRIAGVRNFVEPDSSINWKGNGTHGSNVLSIMGGQIPGTFTGSAPEATYWMIETEDARSEFKVEEANWLAGAELADSAGADIINSSLGYFNVFTDPSQNYSIADINGETALVTRAAQLASDRGILVVASAGNEGRPENSWGYITPPSDGESVLAVGAVDANRLRAVFSSTGPTLDGRIKPDLAAMGVGTWYINAGGLTQSGNGTSYSSPLIAGLAACLWQKHPELSAHELLTALRESGSQAFAPDNLLGFGIPNFLHADRIITGEHPAREVNLSAYPNPARDYLFLFADEFTIGSTRYRIFDLTGRECQAGSLFPTQGGRWTIPISSLNPGGYILSVQSGEITWQTRIFKTR
jgi:subtilisin family serine protease